MFFCKRNEAKDDLLADREPNRFAGKLSELFIGKMSTRKLAGIIAIFGLLTIIFMYVSGFVVNIQNAMDGKTDLITIIRYPWWRHYATAIFSLRGWLYVLIADAVIFLFLFFVSRSNTELTSIKSTDSRQVDFAEKGTYGTAEWMTKEEAKEIYEVTEIDKARGVILAQFTENGKEVICLPEDTKDNRNILILGSPGTGKSYCYVRNAAFQVIVRGESAVITDPKGELYESTSEIFRKNGYKVEVFNLVNPKRSDAWDCMSEIYDPETGDISDIRVTEFTDTLMKNTSDGPTNDFWGTGENNLMRAIVMYCAWQRETNLKALYESKGKNLLPQVGNRLTETDKQLIYNTLTGANPHTTMNERKRAFTLLVNTVMGTGSKAANDFIRETEMQAPACNIGSMYFLLSTNDLAQFEEKFKAIPISHPAAIAWGYFKAASDNVRPGLVQGLGQRLQLFQMADIRRITTNDDIHLEDLGKEKTALFVIISDKSPAMRPLTSMFFTFLFKDVADAADRFGPKNRLYVNVLCDEFANLGVIPSFDVTISTVRSRRINISIILQSVMQLVKNYEEAQQTIISCCDTILFLGCNDTETANFISELSGTASIRVMSSSDSRNTSWGSRSLLQGYSVSEGAGKRMLMNPDEVRRLSREDVLVYHRGYNILLAHRCGFDNHKFYRIYPSMETPLRNYPLASDKYALTEGNDAFLVGDIANMTRRNQEIVNQHSLDRGYKKHNNTERPIELTKVDGEDNSFDF